MSLFRDESIFTDVACMASKQIVAAKILRLGFGKGVSLFWNESIFTDVACIASKLIVAMQILRLGFGERSVPF